jgi:hypothetical protein
MLYHSFLSSLSQRGHAGPLSGSFSGSVSIPLTIPQALGSSRTKRMLDGPLIAGALFLISYPRIFRGRKGNTARVANPNFCEVTGLGSFITFAAPATVIAR